MLNGAKPLPNKFLGDGYIGEPSIHSQISSVIRPNNFPKNCREGNVFTSADCFTFAIRPCVFKLVLHTA